jgi:RNA polymerase sigma-70 factor (ECF subfamily)
MVHPKPLNSFSSDIAGSLYGFFRRRLNDIGRAEDLTQETFVAVIRGTERYEPRSTFRTYLYAIAIKLLWGERRRVVREARSAVDAAPIQHHIHPGTTLSVQDALDKLPGDQREVLMLREYEQLSYDEIAAVLHIPINTVRSRLFRARADLKALLEPQTVKEATQ